MACSRFAIHHGSGPLASGHFGAEYHSRDATALPKLRAKVAYFRKGGVMGVLLPIIGVFLLLLGFALLGPLVEFLSKDESIYKEDLVALKEEEAKKIKWGW